MRRPDDPTTSTDAQSGEGFLGRWARRKRDSLTEPGSRADQTSIDDAASGESASDDATALTADVSVIEGASGAPAPGTMLVAGNEAPAEQPQEVVLTDADMPALSSLGDEDDYSGFMSPGVSEGLRNKALRQLFMSAQFNVLDGLNDYDDDFTTFEALGDIVTSDMRHQMEMEAERAEREAQRLAQEEAEQRDPEQPVLEDASVVEAEASQGSRVEMEGTDHADPTINTDELLDGRQLALASDTTRQHQQRPKNQPGTETGTAAPSDEPGGDDEPPQLSGSTVPSKE